jgi:hypothetical protein
VTSWIFGAKSALLQVQLTKLVEAEMARDQPFVEATLASSPLSASPGHPHLPPPLPPHPR